MALTLFLADDHAILRQGLRALLNTEPSFRIVGDAGDGLETVRLVEKLRPAVLLLDLQMPGIDGLEVARRVSRRSVATHIVILSMHDDPSYVAEAIHAGAVGFVRKGADAEELVKAIRQAASGERYLSSSIPEDQVDQYLQKLGSAARSRFEALTPREREVLQLTVEGLSGSEIAKRLFISRRTVESHRTNLMDKIGVRNLKELIRIAVETDIVFKSPQLKRLC